MRLIAPDIKNLGGFEVRRLLPSSSNTMVGPWIFFDHMGPTHFDAGDGINVRPHPHINLATVTYLFEGEILHRDSLGNQQIIRPGDINLMVAGKGITHSERKTEKTQHTQHTLHGLQLWHALPDEYEEIEPAFYHHSQTELPHFSINEVEIRLLMGEAYQHCSPVKTFTKTLYFEATLTQGQQLELPYAPELAVYIVSGDICINDMAIPEHHLVVLDSHQVNELLASSDSRIVVIGGSPVGYRYIEWNFVSSRKERITKAKKQWMRNKFDKVIADEDEYIPLPKSLRISVRK